MPVATIVCVVSIVFLLTVLMAACAPSCPDCGCVLEFAKHADMTERYKCTHCGAKWWYHQIHGRQ